MRSGGVGMSEYFYVAQYWPYVSLPYGRDESVQPDDVADVKRNGRF